MEGHATPELLPGSNDHRFTAGDWIVTVSIALVPVVARVCWASLSNPTTGFWWEGWVSAQGHVTERSEIVSAACDIVFDKEAMEFYAEWALPSGLTWVGGRITRKGLGCYLGRVCSGFGHGLSSGRIEF